MQLLLSGSWHEMCVYFIVFMEKYLTHIRKISYQLGVTHVILAGSQKVMAAFKFTSESTVER